MAVLVDLLIAIHTLKCGLVIFCLITHIEMYGTSLVRLTIKVTLNVITLIGSNILGIWNILKNVIGEAFIL